MYLTNKKYWPVLFSVDIVGSIIFFPNKFRKKPMQSKIRKVLFIRLEHIGDMIMSTPVFENFKKSNPKCEVHVLCKTITKTIIKNNPYVDKIITFDPNWMIKRKEDKKKGTSELVSELKEERYDIIFEMHGDPRNNRLANMIAASETYTVGYGCRGAGFFLNEVKKYNPKIRNIDQNLELIKDYAKITTRNMKIFTDKKAKDDALKIMKKFGLKKNAFIIINPKSGRSEKDLTVKEVNNFIKRHKAQKILLTGSKAEREYNESLKKNAEDDIAGSRIINISGQTDLLTLAELVKNAKLVIAPDTGIIHMAKAVGTKFEAVYKTTDKNVWGY